MKKLLVLTTLLWILQFGCNKTETIMQDKGRDLTQRTDTITEIYVYDDITYTLYFDSEDDSGDPLNTDVEDELIDAIGSNEFFTTYRQASGDTVFITNVDDALEEEDSTWTSAVMSPPVLATYYEDVNFGGSSFNLTPNYPSLRNYTNGNTCNDEYMIPDLSTLYISYPSTTWDNKISSFKMHQSYDAKYFYDTNGWSGNGAVIQFVMFRNPGRYQFNTSGHYMQIWEMRTSYGVNQADWTVSNLRKEKWAWLWPTNMNDCVSAVTARVCKKNNSCSGGCTMYLDLIR